MGVKSVELKYASASGAGDLTGKREYLLVFEVLTTSYRDGVIAVGNAGGIPHKGAYYQHYGEADPGALCRKITPRQIDKTVWEVSCHYSSEHGDEEQNQQNPLLKPPRRSWRHVRTVTYPGKDLDDKPFVNSAGERFGPDAAAIEEVHPVLVIERNEAYFDFAVGKDYQNSVNSDRFYGWDPGTARLILTADEAWAEGMAYAIVTYEIEFNERGWNTPILDDGSFYLEVDDETGDKERVYPQDKNGIAATSRVMLDGAGGKLSQAQIDAEEFQYIDFRRFKSRRFATLRL